VRERRDAGSVTVSRIDPTAPDPTILERAATILRSGGLVAFPTETVYGLGAHALDAAAVARIFTAKGRPAHNPLIVHVADAGAARALCAQWPDSAARLAARWWPGPLTLVLPKRAEIPDSVTAGLDTVAVRVPAHPLALALLGASALPIAAPSANRSGAVSPTTAAHVERGLGDRVDLILDSGPTPVGIESAVVSLVSDPPLLLRPGTISLERLRETLPGLQRPTTTDEGGPLPSPGMLERHYAPRARLLLVTRDELAAAARERESHGAVGALLLSADAPGAVHPIRMPGDAAAYAARLYAALHDLDDAGCATILVETPPLDAEWTGVRDRLARAAR
jgi:L-threonylcarbamoyladenylate synthase